MFNDEIQLILSENEEKLRRYVELLVKANETARLTGPSDTETLWNDHVADCAAAVVLLPRGGSVIDVGTGGGLPGIVWAIARPDLEFTLLDSVAKKIAQVDKISLLLGLKNVKTVCARSEDYAKERGEKFVVATARAVTAAGVLAELLVPFVKIGGRIICFKGPKVAEELEVVGNKWTRLGLASPKLTPYSCGCSEKKHFLLIWEKIGRPPKGIPRRPGMAEKFPWYEIAAKAEKTSRQNKNQAPERLTGNAAATDTNVKH